MKYTTERWIDIRGYDGCYQISSLGRVKSLEREVASGCTRRIVSERILKPIVNGAGYAQVNFTRFGRKTVLIHRLVADAFLDLSAKEVVNHIDFNKLNNRVENLEVCSQMDNIRHSCIGGRNGRGAVNINTGVAFLTVLDAARSIDHSYSGLLKRLSGKIPNNTPIRYAFSN